MSINDAVAMKDASGDMFTREYYEEELYYAERERDDTAADLARAWVHYYDAENRLEKARKNLEEYGKSPSQTRKA